VVSEVIIRIVSTPQGEKVIKEDSWFQDQLNPSSVRVFRTNPCFVDGACVITKWSNSIWAGEL